MATDEAKYGSLAELVDAFQAEGRYTFGRAEAIAALQVTGQMLRKAAQHLTAKKRIAVPDPWVLRHRPGRVSGRRSATPLVVHR